MEDIILDIQNLYKRYGSKLVLNGVSLQVRRGEIIGYIGPNGAGKSTTVKILLGIEGDFNGEVKIFGRDIADGDVNYKRRIGYVPEMAEVYDNLTAQEYLTFIGELYGLPFDFAEYKAKRLMELFGIGEVFRSRISSYSKGMRQKLLIISSLLHNPDVLFFDEPINGLDANSVMIFKEIMTRLAQQGKTIFYSSHIMDVVEKISSRIILLHDGKIAADGTFDELKSQNTEGTLEQIFNQLTGFNQQKEIGERFVSVVEEMA
ncbi:ABC transporter ATP-binding protein [Cytobacillus sp. FSL W7-1323]|uniref:ABC transporter ATP-binding protein n=1 Tax=Cytobacillus TaxID=2675230 RepID=UPI00277F13D3|nr:MULTISPECIES: ABC transporter ATP-binding protein [Cytobacillus]MDQ0186570.1 ABC-2 type transport system ATP-binding protein [Cytobacillus kochii]MEA1854027.1 ABC transporter ATP-binding protein [Cytobacillus sp. OWB-43]MED1607860.1 ABC transporter ATP-binding protein [Cytobacillus kochii]